MIPTDLAAALVAAYGDRLERTGALEDPVPPCLAAVLQVLVDEVLPAKEPQAVGSPLAFQIRGEILCTIDALEAIND